MDQTIRLRSYIKIHPDFYSGGCSSVNSEEFLLTGRPHGGLAVLWRKTLGCVKTKKYSDRIYGIELTGSDKLLIFNVYLPSIYKLKKVT